MALWWNCCLHMGGTGSILRTTWFPEHCQKQTQSTKLGDAPENSFPELSTHGCSPTPHLIPKGRSKEKAVRESRKEIGK